MNTALEVKQILESVVAIGPFELGLIMLSLVAIGLLWQWVYYRVRKNQNINIRNASLTVEELEEHARRFSIAHSVSTKKHTLSWPLDRMNENYKYLSELYRTLNGEVAEKRAVPPAAEWFLDNYYLIEEQVKSLRKDLTKKNYYMLPVLKKGPYKDFTRVHAIAIELAVLQEGHIEESTLLKYLEAYQIHNILFDRELWIIPTLIRMVLIENIRTLCEHINETQKEWHKADEIIDLWQLSAPGDTSKVLELIDEHIDANEELNTAFIEHLFYRLRCSGKGYSSILEYIDDSLDKYGVNTDRIAQNEHNAQAVNTVSLGSCIMSLKYVATHNWGEMFESASYVEKILCQDPDGTYKHMAIESRNDYRNSVEKLARDFGVSELHIAREAVKMATEVHLKNVEILKGGKTLSGTQRREAHVGYYLVDEGIKRLKGIQKNKRKGKLIFKDSLMAYIGFFYLIGICTVILGVLGVSLWVMTTAMTDLSLKWLMIAAFFMLIPASEIAISLINWIVCKVKKPATFYSLELKTGIPYELRTMVVIPALLTNESRVVELLENMENHYLANPEDNLYFALIGAFKDASGLREPSDDNVILTAMSGIKQLNEKYATDQKDLFYFYHRLRTFNESDNNWIGWERKRGALMEFNDMLLGSQETTFSFYSNGNLPAPNIQYVITLDADTQLPMGMAKKMIGTMAHPLNRPVVDPVKGIVVKGYGLMQPRVSFDMDSANRSIFSCIYTQQEGIDPYASAISDVYQDLFGEGIFTGKGIYDLKVFNQVLKDVIPENKVLSHDLLEGTYVRAALVSTLELVDAYPSRYNAFITRLRRWIRGDWQLIPWLGLHIKNGRGERIKNPLSLISKWKIIDNLRRSLIAPSLMTLLLLGFSLFSGTALYWTALALLILFIPLSGSLLSLVFKNGPAPDRIKRHINGFFGVKAALFQSLLSLIFLPYQAAMNLNAIGVTLFRVVITQKNMLEWVASADAEKSLNNGLMAYVKSMFSNFVFGLAILLLSYWYKPADFLLAGVLFVFWFAGPFVAYWISKDIDQQEEVLSPEELLDLRKITRRTWRYFEEFASVRNNYLVPDNYQIDPRRGLAFRTSPTNIGLGLLATLTARDMGYINTTEMVSLLSRTILTVEGLEKWNGHLLNWYDTRTLIPLEPRYVSTVDSGNYVCYLITLIHGLNEYFERPLIDPVYIRGTLDTIRNGINEDEEFLINMAGLESLSTSGELTVFNWQTTLEKFQSAELLSTIEKEVWLRKIEKMLGLFQGELLHFFPWLPLMEVVPVLVLEEGTAVLFEALKTALAKPVGLSGLSQYNQSCMSLLEAIEGELKKIRSEDVRAALSWTSSFKTQLTGSSQQASTGIEALKELITRIDRLSIQTSFKLLYNTHRDLFSIGYNMETGQLTNSYYDLLASEARQTSYLAIARGEVPSKHWFVLGRSLTVVDHYKGLVSWSGTMFEYLMPLLIMRQYKNSLLDETYAFVIESQKKYGRQRHMPWGASESAFYSLDSHLDYQYKAIGVPWLGLKRGLVEDAVTTPYATFLALLVSAKDAYENIGYLKKEGLEGAYGFYEAADYTPERLSTESSRVVIKSYMAHHQGMILLSLNNYLNQLNMQRRFSSDPHMKSARLLLQEKIPSNIVFTKDNKEKIMPSRGVISGEKGAMRTFLEPDFTLSNMHILSNGNYSVLLTDRGTGYSKSKTTSISRWREDSVLAHFGMFFFIKNVETNQYWSSTYAPVDKKPEHYEVVFTSDKALYKRTDEDIETNTQIVVASGDSVEIRQVKLTNNGEEDRVLEVTSYFELVLATPESDLAHPAFSNLFISTEYHAQSGALIANRRTRSDSDKAMWIAQFPVILGETVGDIQYETDRMHFIGRGRTISCPISIEIDKPLSNSVGPVLDPIFSLRVRLKIEPQKQAKVFFVTILSDSRESLMELVEKYSSDKTCTSTFWTALTRSQVETKYLNIRSEDMELYQKTISNILAIGPLRRQYETFIKMNRKGQNALWAHDISGDRPIILVILDRLDDISLLAEVLKAHEYWWIKDLKTDLVILFDEENNYLNPLKGLIKEVVYSSRTQDLLSRLANVFIISLENMVNQELNLFCSVARLIFRGGEGNMREHLANIQVPHYPPLLSHKYTPPTPFKPMKTPYSMEKLDFFNGLGGFSEDGKEYVIRLEAGMNTPMPWINVISNPSFGFIVSESGGGFVWSGNSREFKLTPWSNDPVCDMPSEMVYIRDETRAVWSMTPLPVREQEPYVIKHGFGYTEFLHNSHGIEQSMTQFVPIEDSVKISLVQLRNEGSQPRTLTLTYYMTPILGVNPENTALHLISSQNVEGTLIFENAYNTEFPEQLCFMEASIKERSVTGDKKEFFGKHMRRDPEALKRQYLSGAVGAGYDPCGAMQVNVTIGAFESVKVVFLMGTSSSLEALSTLANTYKTPEAAQRALDDVKAFWKGKLETIQVKTPNRAMDLLMNGWLQYQVITCRMWARSGFYQAGGAFGFRDQLQDSLALLNSYPELARAQILKHAAHQFIEGDVLHWWHEPAGKGTRTRVSDDYLWLAYTTAAYIKATEDFGILEESIPFLEELPLKLFEEERYCQPKVSQTKATLYEHCIRAIENAFKFGQRGLPLIGSGDWNDGMNNVGSGGKGESVWLGWFLSATLQKFIPLCEARGDKLHSMAYEKINETLVIAIEEQGWDGNWYRRAYFDNGMMLGSASNNECKIDSLAQSWAVISESGEPGRAQRAMASLENYLVMHEDGLIKLLTPPFEDGELEPGYIKGYVAGVRENGGQYTHAAAWVIVAAAMQGEGDKAQAYFDLINPINHARTNRECSVYRVEPYVMAADVYGEMPHVGRGGWTWYTGSAGWVYKSGMENILGLNKIGNRLVVEPCISQKWQSYEIDYQYHETQYHIEVSNPEGISSGIVQVHENDILLKGNSIPLINDGETHEIHIVLGVN